MLIEYINSLLRTVANKRKKAWANMPLFSKKRAVSESPCRQQQSSIPIPSSASSAQPPPSANTPSNGFGNRSPATMFFKINASSNNNVSKPSGNNNKIGGVGVGGDSSASAGVAVTASASVHDATSIGINSLKGTSAVNEVN